MAAPVALESVVIRAVEIVTPSLPQHAHIRPPDRSEPASGIPPKPKEMQDESVLRQRQTLGQSANIPPAREESSTDSGGPLTPTSSEDSQPSKGSST